MATATAVAPPTPIEAIQLNDFAALRALVGPLSPEAAKALLAETDAWGDTALHWAALSQNVLLVRYLTLHGADVNAVNAAGSTPLHKAATTGSQAIYSFLTEQGAESRTNLSGFTPFDYTRTNRELFLRLLGKKHASSTLTVSYGKIALVIGKEGSKLDDIREKTGVNVTVPHADRGDTSDREIFLSAQTDEQIDAAKELITTFLASRPDTLGGAAPGSSAPSSFASSVEIPREGLFSQYSKTITVPKKSHRRLIGKAAATLNRIQDSTGAKVHVPPSKSKSEEVVIVGDPREVQNAIAQIRTAIKEIGSAERKTVIPKKEHRRIIGKGGETIKELQSKYNVDIKIPQSSTPDETIVVRGDARGIDLAIYEMQTIIQDAQRRDQQRGERGGRGRGRGGGRGGRGGRNNGGEREEREGGSRYERHAEQEEAPKPKKKKIENKPINLDDANSWPSF
eukprot:TRINITY_DN2689_c0_g1_i1.p1 TRINITY_DN2689_c0_g1~~TRINITY_DN2689_c0_g1_i1.p1  ORF type:complete len:470 (-),score=114.76 TRINITY_DN2689_c0_g1_i1:45-1406(-)